MGYNKRIGATSTPFIRHFGFATGYAVFVLLTLSAAFGGNLAAALFESHKNDVVGKVADLRQKYRDVTSNGLDFSPDNANIAVDAEQETINVWSLRSHRVDATITKLEGANDTLLPNPITYSPDGRLLAACHSKSVGEVVVRIWKTDHWSIQKDISDSGDGGCAGMAFTSDGQFLVRVAARTISSSEFVVHTVETWQQAWSLTVPLGAQTLALSHDGVFAAINGSVLVRPANVADPVKSAQQSRLVPSTVIVDMRQHKVIKAFSGDAMGATAWSADGRRIAIAGGGYLEIFDVRTGERLVHKKIEESAHMNVRFTSDGRFFVQSDMNGLGTGLGVEIWDSQYRNLLQHIPGNVAGIAVSRDGRYLALGDTGVTTIWQFR